MSSNDSVGRNRDWRRLAASSPDVMRLVVREPRAAGGLVLLVLQWVVIATAVFLALEAHAWPVTLLALIVIGTRQHALLVLLHDATHVLLCRDRRINDMAAALLAAFPLLMSVSRYRAHHLEHHRHLNTPLDPDISDAHAPSAPRALRTQLLCDLTGLSTLKSLRSIDTFGVTALWRRGLEGVMAERALFVAVAVVAAATTTATGMLHLLLLFWGVPMSFVLPALLRVRSLGEHAGLLEAPRGMDSRSIVPHWWERLSVAPCNINRHWEHHLFPKVPCYRLERLSAALKRAVPPGRIHETAGYFIGRQTVFVELFPTSGSRP